MHTAPEHTEPQITLDPDDCPGALKVVNYMLALRREAVAMRKMDTDYDKTVGLLLDDILGAIEVSQAQRRAAL